jgi:hypothetical protein
MNYKKSLQLACIAAVRKRRLIIFFLAAHAVFLGLGILTMNWRMPGALALRDELMKEVQDLFYVQPITGPLAASLGLKILYTFLFNLVFGAFVSTTVTGLSVFLPYVLAVWRSFVIGLLFQGMDPTPLQYLVFFGTALFEFGAYSFSSALGTDLGLSLFFPSRQGTASRAMALKKTFRQDVHLYIFVALLLLIGAVWEITWLHYLGPLISPPAVPS